MRWRKLGVIFTPERQRPWLATHAAVPTPLPMGGALVRVYFSPRDSGGRSLTAWVDVDVRARRVVSLCKEPVLAYGRPGMFDDSGAMACSVVNSPEGLLLYYIGWNKALTVPFRNAIGVAVATSPSGPFVRYSEGPVLDRSLVDHCFVASPHVHRTAEGWRMWYLSCCEWTGAPERPQHHYDIKYATSHDGIHWSPTAQTCIPLQGPGEHAISRPWVVKDDPLYRMWYSHRGAAYRIGYAESADGVRWERLDHLAGIGVSDSGWDSEMIEYPCVFDADGERYMLYNGNGFGASGIGLAVLTSD
jgi:hypothetical protein